MTRTTIASRILTGLAAGVLALGLAACAQEEQADSTNLEAELQAWVAEHDSCMRDQGVDPSMMTPGATVDPSQGQLIMDAQETCDAQVGAPPKDPDVTDEELQEVGRTAAQCLRDAGYDAQDPSSEDEGLMIPDGVPQDVLDECLRQGER